MDGIGDVFAAIIEAIVRVLYGIIRLIIRIIGFVLSKTWLVSHFAALRAFGFWLAVAMALYLGFGILRAGVPAFATPALTPIYQWQFVLIGIVVMLLGIAMRDLDPTNYALDDTHHKFEPDRAVAPKVTAPAQPTGPITTLPTVHSRGLIATVVLAVLVVGVISAVSSERHEATLAQKLCDEVATRVSDGTEQAVRDGAGLFDRVFGTQTAAKIPCAAR